MPGKPSYKIIQSLLTLLCDDKNFSPADQPEESKCKVVDSSVLARQKARERSGGRQLIDTSGPRLVSRHPSPRQLFPVAVYTHLMPPPPILPAASLLHGAPRPSCISMLYERWRGGGTRDWERGRGGMEGGLGSAVRPRQQSESIKSAGLLLHWVVINRSWTLSPARRADRVNEGPKAAPHPPPLISSQFSLSSQSPPFLWLVLNKGKAKRQRCRFCC